MERNRWVSRPSSVSRIIKVWSVCNFHFDSGFVIKPFFNGSILLLRLARDQNSKIIHHILIYYKYQWGTHFTVGWGIALQARSQVQFLTGSLEFFIDLSSWPCYGPGFDTASKRNEYQDYLLRCKGRWWVGLTNLPPSFCQLSWNLEASTSWSHKGLSRLLWNGLKFKSKVKIQFVLFWLYCTQHSPFYFPESPVKYSKMTFLINL